MGINMIQLLRELRFFYLINIKWKRFTFGRNPYFGRSVYMWAKHSITIGDNFYIGKFSQIECDAEIGDNVMFANCVALIGRYDHKFTEVGIPIRLASKIRDKDYNWKGLNEKIVIADDIWVGHGSIILSGINIGQGSIIAAGSVVTRDVEPFSIYAGNPARKIRNRFDSETEKNEHIRLYNDNFLKNSLNDKRKSN
jgi:acetyltransferase-like isoleucine patch superfamily enzyme